MGLTNRDVLAGLLFRLPLPGVPPVVSRLQVGSADAEQNNLRLVRRRPSTHVPETDGRRDARMSLGASLVEAGGEQAEIVGQGVRGELGDARMEGLDRLGRRGVLKAAERGRHAV